MKLYSGVREYDHRSQPRVGVLLVNLGTPDAPTKEALRPYLKDFLSDPRVIEIPAWKWKPILNLFILPFRPKRSAALYQKVWTPEGSPLLLYTLKQKEALQKLLDSRIPGGFIVDAGMRIGNPNISVVLDRMRKANVQRLLVIPMFPQYSGTTSGSVFDGIADVFKSWRWIPELRIVGSYHDNEKYIDALAQSVRERWSKEGKPQKLLLSFHGIPLRYFENGDPYFCHCHKTARLLAEKLQLNQEEYVVSFQSLFGREEWLRPYTNETLAKLAKAGVKNIDVICPGFSADCLETIEEIEEENKEVFLHNGGERFRYIEALNDRPEHIEMLADLVHLHTQGWPLNESTPVETRLKRVNEVKAANE